jgi:hypothetical protein
VASKTDKTVWIGISEAGEEDGGGTHIWDMFPLFPRERDMKNPMSARLVALGKEIQRDTPCSTIIARWAESRAFNLALWKGKNLRGLFAVYVADCLMYMRISPVGCLTFTQTVRRCAPCSPPSSPGFGRSAALFAPLSLPLSQENE